MLLVRFVDNCGTFFETDRANNHTTLWVGGMDMSFGTPIAITEPAYAKISVLYYKQVLFTNRINLEVTDSIQMSPILLGKRSTDAGEEVGMKDVRGDRKRVVPYTPQERVDNDVTGTITLGDSVLLSNCHVENHGIMKIPIGTVNLEGILVNYGVITGSEIVMNSANYDSVLQLRLPVDSNYNRIEGYIPGVTLLNSLYVTAAKVEFQITPRY